MTSRFLIDTHCWLWWHAEPEKLSTKAYDAVAESTNEIFFSVASAWEISIKYALGKLKLPLQPGRYITDRLRDDQMISLPIQLDHAIRVGQLPMHHRDPFDRLLVAQAQLEKLVLITTDKRLKAYDVTLI